MLVYYIKQIEFEEDFLLGKLMESGGEGDEAFEVQPLKSDDAGTGREVNK